MWEQNVCNIIMLTVCMENGRVGRHHGASMCQPQPSPDRVVRAEPRAGFVPPTNPCSDVAPG